MSLNFGASLEPIARLLQSHDLIQWYEADVTGLAVGSEGWPGHLSSWQLSAHEILAAMSVLRSDVPYSQQLLE